LGLHVRNLSAGAEQQDAKGFILFQTFLGELLVTRLKDMQRQLHVREKHNAAQREES
jgi:hypothetical protein